MLVIDTYHLKKIINSKLNICLGLCIILDVGYHSKISPKLFQNKTLKSTTAAFDNNAIRWLFLIFIDLWIIKTACYSLINIFSKNVPFVAKAFSQIYVCDYDETCITIRLRCRGQLYVKSLSKSSNIQEFKYNAPRSKSASCTMISKRKFMCLRRRGI